MLWAALITAVAALLFSVARFRHRKAILEGRVSEAARELELLQRAFARFAPAPVVDDIARGLPTRSEKKEVTVLFADLQGFTPLAERLDPTVLVEVLNGWFERMSRAISGHRGHVAKFIGDGVLALFGALEANPWQTNDAGHAALAMRDALAHYNAMLVAAGRPALAMGIGIHRGVAVAGVMGSVELMEYGVVGDTVNLASRVERLTRAHGVDILVTEGVRMALDRRFRLRAMPAVRARGVSEALVTYALEGFGDGSGP